MVFWACVASTIVRASQVEERVDWCCGVTVPLTIWTMTARLRRDNLSEAAVGCRSDGEWFNFNFACYFSTLNLFVACVTVGIHYPHSLVPTWSDLFETECWKICQWIFQSAVHVCSSIPSQWFTFYMPNSVYGANPTQPYPLCYLFGVWKLFFSSGSQPFWLNVQVLDGRLVAEIAEICPTLFFHTWFANKRFSTWVQILFEFEFFCSIYVCFLSVYLFFWVTRHLEKLRAYIYCCS